MKLIALLTIAFLILLIGCKQPAQHIQVADLKDSLEISQASVEYENTTIIKPVISKLEFTGYGIGEYNTGTFEEYTITGYKQNQTIVGLFGTIKSESIETGIGAINSRLRNEKFLEVQAYPTILFNTTSISKDTITADITIKGITNRLSFPATINENTISAEFLINTTQFNMGSIDIDERVRIAIILELE